MLLEGYSCVYPDSFIAISLSLLSLASHSFFLFPFPSYFLSLFLLIFSPYFLPFIPLFLFTVYLSLSFYFLSLLFLSLSLLYFNSPVFFLSLCLFLSLSFINTRVTTHYKILLRSYSIMN